MAYVRTQVRRGEVYYISFEDAYGSEQRTGRPGVVVSSDAGNESSPVVMIVYMTTNPQRDNCGINVPLNTPTRKAWALCNQLRTVDKSRLSDRMCVLSLGEMRKIDEALCVALDLPVVEPKRENENEVEVLRKAVADASTEIEVLKRAYERVLDKLVDRRIAEDVAARTAAPVELPVVEETPLPVLVDINRASFDELKKVIMSDNVCLSVISGRPYLKTEDIKRVPGVTQIMWGLIKTRITVGDTGEYKKSKVNVNTVKNGAELKEKTGMNRRTADSIIRYRKQVGKIGSVAELVNAEGFGKTCMTRYGDMLTV